MLLQHYVQYLTLTLQLLNVVLSESATSQNEDFLDEMDSGIIEQDLAAENIIMGKDTLDDPEMLLGELHLEDDTKIGKDILDEVDTGIISQESPPGKVTSIRMVLPGETRPDGSRNRVGKLSRKRRALNFPKDTRKRRALNFPKDTRKRRALNFPKDTTLQFGVCYFPFVVGTHGLFNFGITLGSNWDVPENPLKYKYPAVSSSRRERRSLYPKMESILTRMGLHGKHCVLHALCHLSHRRRNKSSSQAPPFLDAILGVLFHYPPSRDVREPKDHYDSASDVEDCTSFEELCPELSLVLAVFGQL